MFLKTVGYLITENVALNKPALLQHQHQHHNYPVNRAKRAVDRKNIRFLGGSARYLPADIQLHNGG